MSVMQKSTAKNVALLSNHTYDTGKGQAFDDYLWDTNFMPIDSSKRIQFFKTNGGSQYGAVAGDAKTEIETSMEDTGKLPAGQSFLINAITCSLISNAAVATTGVVEASALSIVNAYRLVMTHSVWEIKFSNTEYSWRDSGSIFLPSVFEMGTQQSTTDLGISNTQIGNFAHYNWIKVSTRVPVSEQVNFSINVIIGAGAATVQTKVDNALEFLSDNKVEWRCQLKGMLIRKV